MTELPDGTILYDGVCVLCSAWFRFVSRRDPAKQFTFVAIQHARAIAIAAGIDPDVPATNAVVLGGRVLVRSDAAIAVLMRLPGWRWVGALRRVPRPARDWLYDRVARNRYRLFGRLATCPAPLHGGPS